MRDFRASSAARRIVSGPDRHGNAAAGYGTILSRIGILRAVASREFFSTVPYVHPGGEGLLHLSS
jgi:hypothetical protein